MFGREGKGMFYMDIVVCELCQAAKTLLHLNHRIILGKNAFTTLHFCVYSCCYF